MQTNDIIDPLINIVPLSKVVFLYHTFILKFNYAELV